MAAMLDQHLFTPSCAYTTDAVTAAAASSSEAGSRLRRPASPPQPVPARRQQVWEDAVPISASPASSDATEQFLDCFSEIPSAASSYSEDSGAAVDERLAAALPRLSLADALAAASSTASSSATHDLQHERQRRLAAEAALAELRQQLDDISSLLFAYCGSDSSSAARGEQERPHGCAPAVAATLRGVLQQAMRRGQQAEEQAEAAWREAREAAQAAADDAAFVARLVAGMCARAAAVEDLGEQWQRERSLLERRLEQAARMGQAMLKHQKEHSIDPEPWRQQLLNAAVSVGCSVLGAAAAVLIIKRAQAA